MSATAELDAERGQNDYYEACAYYCEWCDDDADADKAFAQHDLR